jgi:hypothetical protein
MYPHSSQSLMRIEFSRQIFEKYANIKFHENPSRGSRVVSYGQKDRQTDTKKLMVVFRNFVKKQLNITMSLHSYSIILEIFTAQRPVVMRQIS